MDGIVYHAKDSPVHNIASCWSSGIKTKLGLVIIESERDFVFKESSYWGRMAGNIFG